MRNLHYLYIIIFVLHYAGIVQAQEPKITIREHSIALKDALREIESQSLYSIGYVSTGLDTDHRLHLLLQDASLTTTIETILQGTNYTYRIMGRHILLIPDENSDNNKPINSLSGDGIKNSIPAERHYLLEEILVTASSNINGLNKNRYQVTSEMRQGISTTPELFDHIHNLRYDKLSGQVQTAGGANVLILINGIQQPEEYLRNISPDRIEAIEVITEPNGRYVTDGYTALANLLLKENYTGYDINIHAQSIITPSNNNGNEWLARLLPGAGINYTNNRISLFANYLFTNNHWNTPLRKRQEVTELMIAESEPLDSKTSVNNYKSTTNHIETGISYQFNPYHNLTLQATYMGEDENNGDIFNFTNTYLANNEKFPLHSITNNQTQADDYTLTAFYQGKISKQIELYTDLTYNRYSNEVLSTYTQSDYYHMERNYNESKNYLSFNAQASYKLTPDWQIELLYTHTSRTYNSHTTDEFRLLKHSEYRSRPYISIAWQPKSYLNIVAGAGMEHIRNDHDQRPRQSHYNLQPYLRVAYRPTKNIRLSLACTTNNEYPTLFQLSRAMTINDSLSAYTGNPDLQPAHVRHATISADYADRLTLKATYSHTNNGISEVNTIPWVKTFENIRYRQYTLQAIYTQPFSKYIRLKSNITLYKDRASWEENKNSRRGWLTESELSYFHPSLQLGATIGYSRNLRHQALPQGYRTIGLDTWNLGLNKQFLDGRASLALFWYPPIQWGTRDVQRKEIQTSYYNEQYDLSTQPYQNMLLVKFGFRFGNGKVNRPGKASSVSKEKRRGRTVDFR